MDGRSTSAHYNLETTLCQHHHHHDFTIITITITITITIVISSLPSTSSFLNKDSLSSSPPPPSQWSLLWWWQELHWMINRISCIWENQVDRVLVILLLSWFGEGRVRGGGLTLLLEPQPNFSMALKSLPNWCISQILTFAFERSNKFVSTFFSTLLFSGKHDLARS